EVWNGGSRLIGHRLMLLHLKRGLGVISPEFVTSNLRLSTLYPKISFSIFCHPAKSPLLGIVENALCLYICKH
ncbi:hypothetical protein, partial [Alloprevotella tannerae]|uniref:hypothetical protein n=1 Tax=Alloprevotella tannerae TaxID=76122 RepID=UPI0028E99D3B